MWNMRNDNAVAYEPGQTPAQQRPSDVPVTTLIIRNIPRNYTQEMLLREWPIDGSYDFLYMPPDKRCAAGAGYAFVNFRSEALATEFKATWHRRRLGDAQHTLSIIPADIQGLAANLRQLKKKRVSRIAQRGWEPIILEPEGQLQ